MPPENVQSSFLEQIKKKLPINTSLADEIAETLNISRDSAYRRIRGETVLSLDEAKTLCNKFEVSLDALTGLESGIIPFRHLVVNNKPETFEQWLKLMLENLELINRYSGSKEIVFTAKDVPVFHYFRYPELCAFKMFFWMKSVLSYPEFQTRKFSSNSVRSDLLSLARKISKTYHEVPSVELWSEETTNVTLKQLEFYHESGFFNSAADSSPVFDEYKQMVSDIKDFAARGYKQEGASFTLYKNEILIADNTVLYRMDDRKTVYISHNITELLLTTHESFTLQTESFINNLQARSVLISTTGEKERNKFFNRMDEKIDAVKKRVG
ncbi:MAG TPA: helix-turn-helix transcriptional regulator [Cyclobacteriaceae bacterium]|nr:helix-turn-helix domain-containing protein [Cyclobacteriaceae bacterium]HMV08194.1 helix-turn-helix transcriptional regulator [Cyclobacteriaceae bacterium]HMV89104.1 helix-turn-helix transcriptional regulator [Cyclobacteriaceae bacterium]HMX02036.1 helix-turn-helix transcriptional regulator [Cyclobacteriaceae bacterium]HMX49988.1 helix-turn-helix transcriptional regulator [Cyclobacteriaceae bacterium]